ncbi:MAG: hypothetical protein Sv326_0500 [Candidatus Fermentimicrarchaeum limneticum]|uniref:Uncharacterized protein n=1 Tax=Fermentimicrarchaeum limneticum TaxID=2795018 RepID=A0A7D6BGP3_FERL1|nr:MAG: hypothetical protein Sv326_0500 [Candidatus Fermentimicrarchaeum limneticum]
MRFPSSDVKKAVLRPRSYFVVQKTLTLTPGSKLKIPKNINY